MDAMRFKDRADAGRRLGAALAPYAGVRALVLALPRGGVPVGYEVARAIDAALDIFLVRKLGVPGHEELAFGAIASGGIRVLSRDVIAALRVSPSVIEEVTEAERSELARRDRSYRGERAPAAVHDRVVIVVDDGLATGASMRAAAAAIRQQQPRRLIIAVPVAAAETCRALSREVDDIVCPYTPEPFRAVGLWYENFEQTTDDEVREMLERAEATGAGRRGGW